MTIRESKAAIWAAYEKQSKLAATHHRRFMTLHEAVAELDKPTARRACQNLAYQEKHRYEFHAGQAAKLLKLYRDCTTRTL